MNDKPVAVITGASRGIGRSVAGEGIMVYEIRPGLIKTDMTARIKDKYAKLIDEGLVPQKRWGLPEDIGKAVVSLARGDWNFSTGMTFEISGGLNILKL